MRVGIRLNVIKMKRYILIFLIFFNCDNAVKAQIPIDTYKKDITNLKTVKDINEYWQNLHKIDQEILVKLKNIKEADSLSIDLMIRTALMFEIHSDTVYESTNVVPILNFSHNNKGIASLAFWPIIMKCKEKGGVINSFGGMFPAYELEVVSLNFYNYSLLNQESRYPDLIKMLDKKSDEKVSSNLIAVFENLKKNNELTKIESLGKWILQPSVNLKEDGFFEFLVLSDNNIYIKKNESVQKLILIEKTTTSNIYRIEKEPFGWFYKFEEGRNLSLLDENGMVLIEYSKHQ